MEEQIRDVLERFVRPLVAADGGTLEIVRADDRSVVLRLGGTCSGCPGAPFTRQRIIERTLRALVRPDVRIDYEQTSPASLRPVSQTGLPIKRDETA
ncbi:MAG: NifU family protein [Deltaproteobacteria bacterium]|nr:NifU family protein [Deltaproteobacteria bacterium]